MTKLIRMGAEFEARGQLVSEISKNDTSTEAELLERLGTKLDRLRTNIHDARKGISKLEHQVSHPDLGESVKSIELAGPCEACGCPRDISGWRPTSMPAKVYLSIPLPRLWHPRRKDLGHWLPRPTLLGWITLMLWMWYISESTMCDYYCHPLYAEFYDWPEEPEPRFGWALPTMLWRWSRIREFGPILLGPLWTLLVALARIIGQAFGWTDGFVDDFPTRSASHPQAKPVALDERIPRVSWGPDLSMMNDEYL